MAWKFNHNETANTLLSGTSGNDEIDNAANYVTINAGAGNDSIWNTWGFGDGDNSSINGGAGNDIIQNFGSNVTIKGGKDNDSIGNNFYLATDDFTYGDTWRDDSGLNVLFQYADGDGNDFIGGFNSTSTLSISGSYSSQVSGSDIIVTVGTGKITLEGAASLSKVNIKFKQTASKISIPSDAYTYNGHSYYLYSNVADTWEAAQTYCEARGGHLAIIDDAKENSALFKYFTNKGYINASFGLSDSATEGTWICVDGTKVKYTNWHSGEPNGGTYENYAEFTTIFSDGKWNDAVLSENFICEWDTVTMSGGNVGVTINNSISNKILTGTSCTDYIYNTGENVTINALGGNDSIYNNSPNVTISTGAGNDTIYNPWNIDNVSIDAGSGNDSIGNNGYNVTIDMGAGNDTVVNWASFKTKIITGAGNDSILNYSSDNVTINTGTGNDSISNSGSNTLFKYKAGDGNDFIDGFNATSTLSIGGGTYSTSTSGDDVIVTVGKGKVTLKGAAGLETVNIIGKEDNLKLITLTEGNDTCNNTINSATINALAGNDTIVNGEDLSTIGANVSINGGAGNDFIKNGGWHVTIDGGDGKDKINNFQGDYSYIIGGAGNDSIYDKSWYSTISAGAGNDTIISYESGKAVSINGGAGKDKISLNSSSGDMTVKGGKGNDTLYGDKSGRSYSVVYQYTSGDGNDIIYNFKATDTLQIGGGIGTYSTTESGSNILVSVGSGIISLIGAAALSSFNVSGKLVETATLKTVTDSTKSPVTVDSYVKVIDASSRKKAVKITGNALDNSIVGGKGKDSLYGGDGADTLSGGAGNDKLYGKAGNDYLDGGAGNDVLSGGQNNDTLTGGAGNDTFVYSGGNDTLLDYASGDKISIVGATINKTTLSGNDVIFTIGSNKLTVKDAKQKTLTLINSSGKETQTVIGAATLKTVTDSTKSPLTVDSYVKVIDAASRKKAVKITGNALDNSIVGGKGKDSLYGGDGADTLSGGAGNDKLYGKAGNDYLDGGAGNDVLSGGQNNDTLYGGAGNDTFVYSGGNDTILDYASGDKISLTSAITKTTVSGSDVVFTTAKGKITVKDAADKTVSYILNGVETTFSASSEEPYIINEDGTAITLLSSYSKNDFDVLNDLPNGGKKIVTIDASAVTHGINITGNEKSNYIIGSKGNDTIEGDAGNDTLKGGDGKDVFVYYDGLGKDTVTDYATGDNKISVVSGEVKPEPSGKDVILNVGKGSVKVKNSYSVGITYIDSDDFEHDYIKGKQAVTVNDTIVTITKNYWKSSFDVANFGDDIKRIDASAVSKNLKITGNDAANQILIGKGNCTVIGGQGDDVIYGGSGANVYVYSQGGGKDIIYNYSSDDTISIESGSVSDISLKKNTVVFTIGSKGKISVDSAGNKEIKYVADGDQRTTIFSSKDNVVENWFVADDNNFATDNDLSALVQSKAIDYSLAEVETSLKSADALDKLTYPSKK